MYYVGADARGGVWPRRVDTGVASAEMTLRIDGIVTRPLPAAFEALGRWLRDLDLAGMFEFSEFLDLRDLERGLPGALERLSPFAVSAALVRSGATQPYRWPPPLRIEHGAPAWPRATRRGDRPWVVVSLRVKADRFEVREAERRFYEGHGAYLWDRLLREVAALTGLPAHRVVVRAPVPCERSLVFLLRGHAFRYGNVCASL